MLFDLRGKRKRAVQVIYVGLALLMGVGLIGLGIGGSANGGIFDALGIGGGSSSSDPQYDDQISKANDALQANPKDEKALTSLTRYEFLSARESQGDVDPKTGVAAQTEDSVNHYKSAIDAWNRYLALNPKDPDDDVAALAIQAYLVTIDPTSTLGDRDLRKLSDTAEIVANARPSFGAYQQLTQYAYIAGDDKLGAEAAAKAKKAATDDTQAKGIDQLVKQAKLQRKAILAQRKQLDQSEGGGQLGGGDSSSGTGSLGGGSSILPPTSGVPTTP